MGGYWMDDYWLAGESSLGSLEWYHPDLAAEVRSLIARSAEKDRQDRVMALRAEDLPAAISRKNEENEEHRAGSRWRESTSYELARSRAVHDVGALVASHTQAGKSLDAVLMALMADVRESRKRQNDTPQTVVLDGEETLFPYWEQRRDAGKRFLRMAAHVVSDRLALLPPTTYWAEEGYCGWRQLSGGEDLAPLLRGRSILSADDSDAGNGTTGARLVLDNGALLEVVPVEGCECGCAAGQFNLTFLSVAGWEGARITGARVDMREVRRLHPVSAREKDVMGGMDLVVERYGLLVSHEGASGEPREDLLLQVEGADSVNGLGQHSNGVCGGPFVVYVDPLPG